MFSRASPLAEELGPVCYRPRRRSSGKLSGEGGGVSVHPHGVNNNCRTPGLQGCPLRESGAPLTVGSASQGCADQRDRSQQNAAAEHVENERKTVERGAMRTPEERGVGTTALQTGGLGQSLCKQAPGRAF